MGGEGGGQQYSHLVHATETMCQSVRKISKSSELQRVLQSNLYLVVTPGKWLSHRLIQGERSIQVAQNTV